MSTVYWRTRKTFHRPGCPALRGAWIYHWNWPGTQPDFDPIVYGREALRRRGLVKACLRCFPEVKS